MKPGVLEAFLSNRCKVLMYTSRDGQSGWRETKGKQEDEMSQKHDLQAKTEQPGIIQMREEKIQWGTQVLNNIKKALRL